MGSCISNKTTDAPGLKSSTKIGPISFNTKVESSVCDGSVIPSKKNIRILSIDGGGIRGVIPCILLREIEKITQKHPTEIFDFITGTSIGGIISLALTTPDTSKKPLYSSQDILKILTEHGEDIFKDSLIQELDSLGGLVNERYDSKGIDDVLEKYFADSKISQTLVPIMVTSFDLTRYKPFTFRSWDTKHDFLRKFAARATSAAPTYFELACGKSINGVDFACVDGGVIINNPSVMALVEAKKIYPTAEKITFVSLGTGKMMVEIDIESAKNWGIVKWVRPLINMMVHGASKSAHQQMKILLPSDNYYRLQPKLAQSMCSLDDVSKENVDNLVKLAENYVQEKRSLFEDVCKKLLDNK